MILSHKDIGCVVTVRWSDEDLKGLLVDVSEGFSRVYFQHHPDFSLRSITNDQVVECGEPLVIPSLANPIKPNMEEWVPITQPLLTLKNTCLVCGGQHGSGLPCPTMTPTAQAILSEVEELDRPGHPLLQGLDPGDPGYRSFGPKT